MMMSLVETPVAEVDDDYQEDNVLAQGTINAGKYGRQFSTMVENDS